jgi:signal-transduction protein with cAMP-binding, CBS, and nucleotidyltransferase domain
MAQNAREAKVVDYMSRRMITMEGDSSIHDVATRMAEQNISSVVISDRNDDILGILTERDIVRALSKSPSAETIAAHSLMSHPLLSVESGSAVEDAARIMVQNGVRHLLVEDDVNGEIIGILSATDLLRYLKKNLADEEIAASEVWELFS